MFYLVIPTSLLFGEGWLNFGEFLGGALYCSTDFKLYFVSPICGL
jgi:predicted outer membrane repeat protein